jgi:hypothetical protein
LGVRVPKVKEIVDWLKTYNQEEHIAVAVWSVDDVLVRARERDIKISRAQAEKIIERIHTGHDASIGINWDVIDAYLDEVKSYGKNL